MDSKIPNIRFKGFTDAWEQRRLGEVTIYQNGKGYEDSQSSSGKFELINLNSISIDGGLKSSGKYIESADKTLLTDDLVMVLSDVGKGDLLGRVAIIPKDNYYVLNQRYFKLHGAGMSQLNISKGSVENFPLLLPSLPEQQQIGTFFAHLDTLISLHQRKCDQTKELKKTMLQKIFPKKGETVPEIRFPEFTDAWEQRKLGEIAERVQGNDGRMDLPTLTISAANGWMDQKERFSGNIAGKEQKNYTLLHKGELSYNHGNSKLAKYGAVFSLETYEEALVPRVYHSFKVINGSSKFIEYYFATKIPDRELAKLVSSGARMDGLLNINFNEFMGINLTVPNKSEQEKISNYFSNLDHLITLHQRKCDELKEIKKTLLKNLFI